MDELFKQAGLLPDDAPPTTIRDPVPVKTNPITLAIGSVVNALGLQPFLVGTVVPFLGRILTHVSPSLWLPCVSTQIRTM